MSDTAFKTASYPGYTASELRARCAEIDDMNFPTEEVLRTRTLMRIELDRRYRVDGGDVSAMTDGERLRYYRAHS